MAINPKILTFMESNHDYPDRAAAGIYEKTNRRAGDCHTVMIRDDGVDKLIANAGFGYTGEPFHADGKDWVLALFTHETAKTLREMYPQVLPLPACCPADGNAPAAAECFAAFESDAYPEHVKNAVRALDHAASTGEQVLDCATFAMFRNC